jgi:quinolinate synthase
VLRLQTPLPEGYVTATSEDLARRIAAAKETLGSRVMILGHHYQRDEVMRWADARGDSFGLSRLAAAAHDAEFVVFCGVHFMAESADVLTSAEQQVILPDLNAGCSMADMADLESVEEAWDEIAEVTDIDAVVPITYMNSSAALKAFVGRHGGAVCTSSNARAVVTWALGRGGARGAGGAGGSGGDGSAGGASGDVKVLFFPDQHLGRNTAFQLGFQAGDMAVWDPRQDLGGLDDRTVKEARFLLWKGHCSVHQRFRPEHVAAFRAEHPGGRVIVHPECSHEVVELADEVGSTDHIIAAAERAPAGSVLGIGTEIHLVQRLAAEHPSLRVVSLDPLICPCSTMFRVDAAHLCWVLEGLVAGRVVNRITVDGEVAEWSRVALQRMLDIT